MNKQLKIQGLHCPNCAKNLQNELNKLSGISNVNIDIVKGLLSFDSKNPDEAIPKIISATKKIEPDVKIIYQTSSKNNLSKTIIDILVLAVGIALGIISCVAKLSPVWFWITFVSSVLLLGYKTYYKAIRLIFKGTINENLLLTISVIGATILGEHMEAFMVIGLYSIGKMFEGLAVDKSRKSIEKLTNLQPEYATITYNGKEHHVDPYSVEIGTIIIVKSGERVPIDGKIISGTATLDMQSLTGESLPISASENDEVMSGSIVLDGVLQIQTTSTYKTSTVSRIMELIEHASEKKSKTETIISKITKWYTLGVIACAVIVWGIVWLVTKNIDTAVYRGLIFLVVSCPCAFAISVPLTYFSGLGNASRHGILIKGSNYLDACSKLSLVAFDKTGTLTTGTFAVDSVESFKPEYSKEDIIYLASLGEQNSLHPLAKSIVTQNTKPLEKVSNIKEVAGEGVYFTHNKTKYFVGRKNKSQSATIVELYEDNKLVGQITLSDQIKHSSKQACLDLKKLGVETILLSGDNTQTVSKVVEQTGIGSGLGNLLPQDKFDWIKNKKETTSHKIGYVGDGINDSPSLMLSDVGISMGINGSPASIEASDIVLVDDNPQKVATAIKISKFTQKIVWQNIIFSAGIKFSFLLLGSLGITGMLWAVFADVGVTVLAILNSLRALAYSPNKNKSRKNHNFEK